MMNNSARDKARKLFLEGYNCAQSVFAACAEELGIGKETALRLSAPMGGGVGNGNDGATRRSVTLKRCVGDERAMRS